MRVEKVVVCCDEQTEKAGECFGQQTTKKKTLLEQLRTRVRTHSEDQLLELGFYI